MNCMKGASKALFKFELLKISDLWLKRFHSAKNIFWKSLLSKLVSLKRTNFNIVNPHSNVRVECFLTRKKRGKRWKFFLCTALSYNVIFSGPFCLVFQKKIQNTESFFFSLFGLIFEPKMLESLLWRDEKLYGKVFMSLRVNINVPK